MLRCSPTHDVHYMTPSVPYSQYFAIKQLTIDFHCKPWALSCMDTKYNSQTDRDPNFWLLSYARLL